MAYGLRVDDTLASRIEDGEGQAVQAKTFSQARDQIRRLPFTGRRNGGWLRPGRDTGTLTITRQGAGAAAIIRQQAVSVQITGPAP